MLTASLFSYLGLFNFLLFSFEFLSFFFTHLYIFLLVVCKNISFSSVRRTISIYALLVIRYLACIISWPKENIEVVDVKTQKLITMYSGLHRSPTPRDCLPARVLLITKSQSWMKPRLCKIGSVRRHLLRACLRHQQTWKKD